MNLLASIWETNHCRFVEAREHDLPAVASILAENQAVFRLLGPERDLEHRALSVLRHDTLPPNGHSAHERSFLVRHRSDDELQGLLSVTVGGVSSPAPAVSWASCGVVGVTPNRQRVHEGV